MVIGVWAKTTSVSRKREGSCQGGVGAKCIGNTSRVSSDTGKVGNNYLKSKSDSVPGNV
jgi:hypothetical protein